MSIVSDHEAGLLNGCMILMVLRYPSQTAAMVPYMTFLCPKGFIYRSSKLPPPFLRGRRAALISQAKHYSRACSWGSHLDTLLNLWNKSQA